MRCLVIIPSALLLLLLLCSGCVSSSSTTDVLKSAGSGSTKAIFKNARGLLKENLLKEYDPDIRPVKKLTTPTDVQIGIHLLSYDLYPDGKLDSNFWLIGTWKDEYLVWEPSEYEGVDTIYLSSYDIWTPDIQIYHTHGQADTTPVRTLVRHTGQVMIVSPVSATTTCQLQLQSWPFDRQRCKLEAGVWVYDRTETPFSVFETDENSTQYVGKPVSTLWRLEGVDTRIVTIPIKTSDSVLYYDKLSVELSMKRESELDQGFSAVSVAVIPLLLLATLWIPVHRPERFAVGGFTTMVSIAIFAITKMSIPDHKGMPRIALLQLMSIILCAISLLVSSVLLKFSQPPSSEMNLFGKLLLSLRRGPNGGGKEKLVDNNDISEEERIKSRQNFTRILDNVFVLILSTTVIVFYALFIYV